MVKVAIGHGPGRLSSTPILHIFSGHVLREHLPGVPMTRRVSRAAVDEARLGPRGHHCRCPSAWEKLGPLTRRVAFRRTRRVGGWMRISCVFHSGRLYKTTCEQEDAMPCLHGVSDPPPSQALPSYHALPSDWSIRLSSGRKVPSIPVTMYTLFMAFWGGGELDSSLSSLAKWSSCGRRRTGIPRVRTETSGTAL